MTTAGFEDLIEVARQDRRELYSLEPTRAELPVPRKLRFGVGCRRTADGSILQRLVPDELSRLRNRLARAGVESIAIGLLHSPTQPADEKAIARALAPLGVPITCSATLLPALGEYERFAAAIINAAIRPVMGNYLSRLNRDVRPGRLRLMRSSLGIIWADPISETSATWTPHDPGKPRQSGDKRERRGDSQSGGLPVRHSRVAVERT